MWRKTEKKKLRQQLQSSNNEIQEYSCVRPTTASLRILWGKQTKKYLTYSVLSSSEGSAYLEPYGPYPGATGDIPYLPRDGIDVAPSGMWSSFDVGSPPMEFLLLYKERDVWYTCVESVMPLFAFMVSVESLPLQK